MKLKRFATYNYNGLTVKLIGFTTDRVWFNTPNKFNRMIDKKLFMNKATYLKDKPTKAKKTKRHVNRPVKAVNIYTYGKLTHECESMNEAATSTKDSIDAIYKSIKNKTMTRNNHTYEYAK